jgi:hypothetical protein
MSDHDNIPATARWIADFIQRIGFPIFMCLALLVLYVWHIRDIETASNASAENLVGAIEKNTEAVTALRHFLTHKYDDN